ncbi:DUF4232 domain-containing protein [Kineococcus gynurae]|uniref:DUF4232 domain-containing protein n=1 Tax=Kineococcus gynurae TaxID=452979 RepID=A0ABV5LRV9_9ACTN
MACVDEDLAPGLAPGATAGAAAGSATITLTNISPRTCTVRGFGGVSLGRSDGGTILSSQQRTDDSPVLVVLAPGDRARSGITWSRTADTAVGEPATGDCEAVPTSLLVIPPDQIAPIAIPWNFGPVCAQGRLVQTPYVAD